VVLISAHVRGAVGDGVDPLGETLALSSTGRLLPNVGFGSLTTNCGPNSLPIHEPYQRCDYAW
jgi:hypothetical protein